MAATWIITTNSSRPIAQIAHEIKQTGCTIQSILEQMGVIVAECDDTTIARVRKLAGVVDAAQDSPMTTQE